jgi:hypothetical protein
MNLNKIRDNRISFRDPIWNGGKTICNDVSMDIYFSVFSSLWSRIGDSVFRIKFLKDDNDDDDFYFDDMEDNQ